MARDESAAERSLRELQEQASARSASEAREAEPTLAPPAGKRPGRPTSRRLGRTAAAVAVVAVLGVGGFLVFRSATAGPEFARSFAEAGDVQEARGREAVAVVEALDPPAEWTASDEEPRISMNGEDGGYAFYDLYFTVPEDYTGADLQAWFEEQETVRASDPEDLTCQTTDEGREVSCVLSFPHDDSDGTPEEGDTRQTLTVSYSADAAEEEGAVNVRGYSTSY